MKGYEIWLSSRYDLKIDSEQDLYMRKMRAYKDSLWAEYQWKLDNPFLSSFTAFRLGVCGVDPEIILKYGKE